jgi:DNA-binding transcriptional ArsR family regulator
MERSFRPWPGAGPTGGCSGPGQGCQSRSYVGQRDSNPLGHADERDASQHVARVTPLVALRAATADETPLNGTLYLYIAIWQYRHMAINELDHLSLVFGALADPTRRAILARLASGDADVSELMKPFDLSQPTISKHLNVLERAGLVVRGRDAQRRPRTLVALPLKDIAEWMEPFRHFWEEKFVGLDEYLKEMQKRKTKMKRSLRGGTKRSGDSR